MDQSFEVVGRESIGRERWDVFVDSSDEAWLWHRFDFQDALATWPGRRDISFALLNNSSGGKIVAAVPLHLIEGRMVRFFLAGTLESLGGPACDNDLGLKHNRKLLEFLHDHLITLARQHGAVQVNVALPPLAPKFRGDRCPRVNPLIEMGLDNKLTQTWMVDLRGGRDAIWANMEGRARTAIRKAEKMDVQVRPGGGKVDLEAYYKLHCETYSRTGVRPHPKAYFEAVWDKFVSKGFARIFMAEYAGEVVAAENFGVYKNAAIYWTGAGSHHALELGANSLIQWVAMQWMIEAGLEWYETGEAFPNIKEGKRKGLNDFKKSFGGMLYPFFTGQMDTSNKTYRVIKHLREICREYKS